MDIDKPISNRRKDGGSGPQRNKLKHRRQSSSPYNSRQRGSSSSENNWSHDLFNDSKAPANNTSNQTNPLFSRLSGSNLPNGRPTSVLASRMDANKPNALLQRMLHPSSKNAVTAETNGIQRRTQANKPGVAAGSISIKGAAGGKSSEISIKGVAGPGTVLISNLAPGTSADDIKMTMATMGKVTKLHVFPVNKGNSVSADITFSSLREAEQAARKLDNVLADGRILSAILKKEDRPETETGTVKLPRRSFGQV